MPSQTWDLMSCPRVFLSFFYGKSILEKNAFKENSFCFKTHNPGEQIGSAQRPSIRSLGVMVCRALFERTSRRPRLTGTVRGIQEEAWWLQESFVCRCLGRKHSTTPTLAGCVWPTGTSPLSLAHGSWASFLPQSTNPQDLKRRLSKKLLEWMWRWKWKIQCSQMAADPTHIRERGFRWVSGERRRSEPRGC